MKQYIGNIEIGNLFQRADLIAKASQREEWDVIVIGGGSTGLGVALDAVSRGFTVLLLEQSDFAKGTSSKSTKLVHGGVRYLAQGDVGLVREALYERGLLLRNAAHLVHNQTFIIPNYDVLNGPFYWVGLKLYDLLAGKLSLGRSEYVKKDAVLDRIPVLIKEGLRNGIRYHDGQFDDARLALNIAQTVIEKGGVALNHFRVKALEKDQKGAVCGVTATDAEQGEEFVFRSKSVVNATGVFANSILEMDDEQKPPLIRPSQGAHIVLDRSFLQSEEAIMIPKTSDGRVLFAVPWHNRVILGTTDVPVKGVALEPKPMEDEIDYILETAGRYLARAPKRSDILSVYAGLRPLAAGNDTGLEKTKEISRSHKILVEESGLITITGGKWTTFRKMGEDTIDRVIKVAGLPTKKSSSKEIKIHGTTARSTAPDDSYLSVYGSDQSLIADLIRANADWAARLHSQLEFTEAEVVFAVRNEMARTIEDVLARRVRMLFLDANAAIECAPRVADILMKELGRDEKWREDELLRFYDVAKGYLISGMKSPIAH
jgi:glycerol-3-phosphate dehydrogenase